jgi:hypothetical protein
MAARSEMGGGEWSSPLLVLLFNMTANKTSVNMTFSVSSINKGYGFFGRSEITFLCFSRYYTSGGNRGYYITATFVINDTYRTYLTVLSAEYDGMNMQLG